MILLALEIRFPHKRKSPWLLHAKCTFWLFLSCATSEIRPSLSPALKLKEDKRNRYFGWVRCRTRTYALLCMKSRNDGLCMQENIHPLGASVRVGEKNSGNVVEPASTNADATIASRCFRGAFAYPLVYTFSISSRGSARPGAVAWSVREIAPLRSPPIVVTSLLI